MQKNGSRYISFTQYRATDMIAFGVIFLLAELFPFAAANWFSAAATFTFGFTVPITLIIMMRWGWQSVIYAALAGVLHCVLRSASWEYYLAYGVGNAAIAVVLIYFKLVGKERAAGKWYLSALSVVIGWCAVVLVRSAFLTLGEFSFPTALSAVAGFSDCGILSLSVGVLLIVIARRFDGLFEDQKTYLTRMGKLREEEARRISYGDELEELDEQSLSILERDNDLY